MGYPMTEKYKLSSNRMRDQTFALLSVSDKTGLIPLATAFVQRGITLLSTGGTARYLKSHGLSVIEVADYTGFPEILGGRVKTLHPKIHAGILARRGAHDLSATSNRDESSHQSTDESTLAALQIPMIDWVIVNLYPFADTIANKDYQYPEKRDALWHDAIEQIDIGGPTLLRAAAKNHQSVTVVVDPADYPRIQQILAETEAGGGATSIELRVELAAKVFAHTARYDAEISQYFRQQITQQSLHTKTPATSISEHFPPLLTKTWIRDQNLRYGENAHQPAAFYRESASKTGAAAWVQHQGKPLSYNNLIDTDTAFNCIQSFNNEIHNQISSAIAVIVKHTNPCGVASGHTIKEAYQRAYAADPTSAFGGIIALSHVLDLETATEIIRQQFVEVILAPAVSADALEILKTKPAVRVLTSDELNEDTRASMSYDCYHSINGGILVQTSDNAGSDFNTWQIATARAPTEVELRDLRFAWEVVRWVKSNAIVCVKNQQTIGIGSGQPNRVGSTELALNHAKKFGFSLQGAVIASDAFFPFADSIEIIAAAGIKAVIQPGGSIRDQAVIDMADKHEIAMVLTGTRHFRH